MKNLSLSGLLLGLLVFTQCSTDVDLIAPYKETTVVYGLLSPLDSVHYFRIAKAYLGAGNAFNMAKENDSIYYPDADIRVILQRWKGVYLQDSAQLVRDESISKDPGIFSSVPNVLYRIPYDPVNHTDSILKDKDTEYKIRIVNIKTGNVVSASTHIVGDVIVSKPNASPTLKISMDSDSPNDITFSPAPNGNVYSVVIRFYYTEKELTPPNNESVKYVDWKPFPEIVQDPEDPTAIEGKYLGSDFFRKLSLEIKPNIGVQRFAKTLDFIFTIGAEEFYTYYLVNQPSLGINQNVPNYTNINNGVGIFSSRNITTLPNKELSIKSLDSLRNGQYTYNLQFQ